MKTNIHSTIKIAGHELPLRFTIGLFAEAQERTGIKFFPLGSSEFWQQDEASGEDAALVERNEAGAIRMLYGLVFAGTQGTAARKAGIDYDYLLENVPVSELTKFSPYISAELERFFQRLAKELKAQVPTSQTETPTTSENFGPSADSTSDLPSERSTT